MWKASAGRQLDTAAVQADDDDWETDPTYVNDISEEEQRYGTKGGKTAGAIDMKKLREETEKADHDKKLRDMEEGPNASHGYGGKFGVEKDRMDKSAMGHDYVGKVEKHESQKDYKTGFGGQFGVQKDRVDKSAVGWEHKEAPQKHESQMDYKTGFGGKFGVQKDRVDKSAVGWDHKETVEKHESQKDYKTGFGGQFGVQKDRVDKSAVGWDHKEAPQKHESQKDYKTGFGGQFGVQSDRMDKSAVGFAEEPTRTGTTYAKTKPDIGGAKPSSIRAKFENYAVQAEEEARKRAEEQKRLREEKDRRDREEAAKQGTVVESQEPASKATQRKGPVLTGREGGIGSAISAFTKSPTEEIPPTIRKEPIVLPKATPPPAAPAEEPKPDVIPQQEAAPPTPTPEPEPTPVVKEEPKREPSPLPAQEPPPLEPEAPQSVSDDRVYDDVEQQEQPEAELILNPDNPGLTAVALYDYQAAAEDEISFDPDDLITHIDMIDEGWWRGFCPKYGQYGLFPANYVQLQNQPDAQQ